MKHFFATIIFCCFAVLLRANDTVIIRKDPRLDILSAKQALVNKRATMMTSGGLYKGYRIQVISTTNRDEANSIKSEVLSRFTDEKAYLLYNSPYFKVRIGNFIKKEDAEKFRKVLLKIYPKGVYVVEDAIEYSMKEEDDIAP